MFWDLYCAAPERREQCDHSSEAKAFHDYVSNKMIHLDEIVHCTGDKFINNRSITYFQTGFCEFRIRRKWHRSRKYTQFKISEVWS